MDYDTWKMDALDHEYDDYCSKCLELQQTLCGMSEFLEEIVHQLYSSQPLDKRKLEHCLDELCFLLRVKMCKEDLKIERTEQKEPTLATIFSGDYRILKHLTLR